MITIDEKILRIKNELVLPEEINDLVKTLEKELDNSNTPGIGLAAPQISINKKIAIIRTKYSINLINPEIIELRHPFTMRGEGCLSVPGKKFNTLRFKEIVVKDFLNPDGMVATGIEAVAIQHEVDHLNGILVMDRSIDIGRNEPCPCGAIKNGKRVKYKKCHGK